MIIIIEEIGFRDVVVAAIIPRVGPSGLVIGREEGIPLPNQYDVDGGWSTSYDMQQNLPLIKERRRSQIVRIASELWDERARGRKMESERYSSGPC
jgi:hypothetical protein